MHRIRQARPEDAATMLEIIKDLAEYEREPDAVMTSVTDILRDGFGERPIFECLLAEDGTRAVGMALYYTKWSTWTGRPTLHLEDLFVKPEYRGKGIGLDLLRRLAQIAVARKCPRFEWEVLDWNKPAIEFYEKLGAIHRHDWWPFRIEGEALQRLGKPGESH